MVCPCHLFAPHELPMKLLGSPSAVAFKTEAFQPYSSAQPACLLTHVSVPYTALHAFRGLSHCTPAMLLRQVLAFFRFPLPALLLSLYLPRLHLPGQPALSRSASPNRRAVCATRCCASATFRLPHAAYNLQALLPIDIYLSCSPRLLPRWRRRRRWHFSFLLTRACGIGHCYSYTAAHELHILPGEQHQLRRTCMLSAVMLPSFDLRRRDMFFFSHSHMLYLQPSWFWCLPNLLLRAWF